MKELISITYESENPTVSGRELHEKLGIGTEYPKWFDRMCEYGFEESKDFNSVNFDEVRTEGTREVKRSITDHILTLDMAKQLCMIQRSDIGRQFREYFLEVERMWNSPEQIMVRAHRIAERTIASLTGQVKQLEAEKSVLTVDLAIAKPKAEYFDELVDRNLLTNFRETAKQLGIPEKAFVGFLIEHKYIYRDKKGKLCAYADKNNGLFDVKECVNNKTNWSGVQTLITPKGRETFRLLCQGLAAAKPAQITTAATA